MEIAQISPDAKVLIEDYKKRLKERQIAFQKLHPRRYTSIEEILKKKYGITDLDEAYKQQLLRAREFLSRAVNRFIYYALEEELP